MPTPSTPLRAGSFAKTTKGWATQDKNSPNGWALCPIFPLNYNCPIVLQIGGRLNALRHYKNFFAYLLVVFGNLRVDIMSQIREQSRTRVSFQPSFAVSPFGLVLVCVSNRNVFLCRFFCPIHG